MNTYIQDFYPGRAQFISNENIKLILELKNTDSETKNLELKVDIFYLGKLVDKINKILELEPLENLSLELIIPGKDEGFKGYGADAYIYENGILLGSISTAFDVVDSYKRAIRYGFLSDFYSHELGMLKDLENICKLHLNVVQFYDWMYRHDELVPPQNEYMDLMGRTLSLEVVKEKIEACHKYGMKAIAYGAVYAAAKDFYETHRDWAFYDSNNNVLSFINIFYIMNIAEESPWHNHIIKQYKNAICELHFDGIHMDTYGFPKTAVSMLGNSQKLVYIDELLPVLIENTKRELSMLKPEVCIIFNNVGNWPVKAVAGTDQEAVYIEVWSPYERYHHLVSIIKDAKLHGGNKPVVLAAYMKPFIAEDTSVEEAQFSTLFATAAIVSCGAFQLILGEDKGILTQGYYVDYTKLQDKFFLIIRKYYDFIVRYSNIFYDSSLVDVSMTHIGGDNLEYVFGNVSYSSYGEANKVWTIVKENKNFKSISLINLVGNNDDYWNRGKTSPVEINNIEVSIQIDKNVKNAFTASPDANMGKEEMLDFTIVDGIRGRNMVIKIPELYIWRILWIEFE